MGQYLDKPVLEKSTEKGKNEYLIYGSSSMQGYRLSNEDRQNCFINLNQYNNYNNYNNKNKITKTRGSYH